MVIGARQEGSFYFKVCCCRRVASRDIVDAYTEFVGVSGAQRQTADVLRGCGKRWILGWQVSFFSLFFS